MGRMSLMALSGGDDPIQWMVDSGRSCFQLKVSVFFLLMM